MDFWGLYNTSIHPKLERTRIYFFFLTFDGYCQHILLIFGYYTLFTGFRSHKDANKRKNLRVSPMCAKVLFFTMVGYWYYINKTVFRVIQKDKHTL